MANESMLLRWFPAIRFNLFSLLMLAVFVGLAIHPISHFRLRRQQNLGEIAEFHFSPDGNQLIAVSLIKYEPPRLFRCNVFADQISVKTSFKFASQLDDGKPATLIAVEDNGEILGYSGKQLQVLDTRQRPVEWSESATDEFQQYPAPKGSRGHFRKIEFDCFAGDPTQARRAMFKSARPVTGRCFYVWQDVEQRIYGLFQAPAKNNQLVIEKREFAGNQWSGKVASLALPEWYAHVSLGASSYQGRHFVIHLEKQRLLIDQDLRKIDHQVGPIFRFSTRGECLISYDYESGDYRIIRCRDGELLYRIQAEQRFGEQPDESLGNVDRERRIAISDDGNRLAIYHKQMSVWNLEQKQRIFAQSKFRQFPLLAYTSVAIVWGLALGRFCFRKKSAESSNDRNSMVPVIFISLTLIVIAGIYTTAYFSSEDSRLIPYCWSILFGAAMLSQLTQSTE